MSYVPAPRHLLAPGSRMDVVCADIDSTLADTRQRRHLCPTVDPSRTWDEYATTCGMDAPITGTITVLRMLHAAGYGIHLVSNRPAAALPMTVSWLSRHDVRYHAIRLRRSDEDLATDIKVAYLAEIRGYGFNPVLFVEDWPVTAAAIEAEGVPVLCVNPRYYDGHP